MAAPRPPDRSHPARGARPRREPGLLRGRVGGAEDSGWAAPARTIFGPTSFSCRRPTEAAQGKLTGRHHLAFQAQDKRRSMSPARRRARAWRHRQRRARRAALSPRLLRRLRARSRRQQHRGRLPRRGQAQRALGQDHVLIPHGARLQAAIRNWRSSPAADSHAPPQPPQPVFERVGEGPAAVDAQVVVAEARRVREQRAGRHQRCLRASAWSNTTVIDEQPVGQLDPQLQAARAAGSCRVPRESRWRWRRPCARAAHAGPCAGAAGGGRRRRCP